MFYLLKQSIFILNVNNEYNSLICKKLQNFFAYPRNKYFL